MLRRGFLVAIVAVVVYKMVQTTISFGFHTHYKKHYPGECKQVKGLDFGSEDLQVTKDGLAFITTGLWFHSMSKAFAEFFNANNIEGAIYLYDFEKPDLGARKLKLTPSKGFNLKTFHPHGISLLEDEVKGEHLLYVISHREHDDDAVEKLRYLPKTNELVHLKTFTGDKLHLTNDLAVTEEDKFYITNCLYFKNYFLSVVESMFLPFGLGSLAYFNGTDFTLVDSWLHSPNGILLSKDNRYLYMNLPFSQVLNVYEIKGDNSVVQVESVNLYTLADNLHLSQSGDTLFTGAHPLPYKVFQHMSDPRNLAPSSVLKLPLKDGKVVQEDITELFYDHGDLISASTVAAVYNNKLLIGSIIDKLVLCDINIKI